MLLLYYYYLHFTFVQIKHRNPNKYNTHSFKFQHKNTSPYILSTIKIYILYFIFHHEALRKESFKEFRHIGCVSNFELLDLFGVEPNKRNRKSKPRRQWHGQSPPWCRNFCSGTDRHHQRKPECFVSFHHHHLWNKRNSPG